MLAAFAQQGFEMFADELQAAIDAAGPNVDDQLRASGLAYVRFTQTHAAHFEVMFRSGVQKGDFPECLAAAERAFGVLADVVWRQIAEADVPQVDPRYLAAFYWALVHGLSTLWIDGSLPFFFEDHTLDELAHNVIGLLDTVGAPPN